jgi:NADP-dependent 3-hydroxy acid dehydrogenase YdfG
LEYPMYGIKITEICPGTIDTVDGEKREIAITADDMSYAINWVAGLPKHVNVNYLEINHISSRR